MLVKEIKEVKDNGMYHLIVGVALRSNGSQIRFIPARGRHLRKHELNQPDLLELQSPVSADVYFFRVQNVFLNLKLVYPPSGAMCKTFNRFPHKTHTSATLRSHVTPLHYKHGVKPKFLHFKPKQMLFLA